MKRSYWLVLPNFEIPYVFNADLMIWAFSPALGFHAMQYGRSSPYIGLQNGSDMGPVRSFHHFRNNTLGQLPY